MRITNAQITAVMHQSMNHNSDQLAKIMQKMASGQRMQAPSDDPAASVRVLRIDREEAALAQYNKNITNVSGNLSIAEANLTSASDAMLNVRDLLLWAANGTNSAAELSAMAGEMENIEKTIVSFFNARDEEGRYRFSGTLSDRAAVSFDDVTGLYSLTGNDKHRQAEVANGVLLDENVTLLQMFGGDADAGFLNELHSLVQALKDPALDVGDPAVQASIQAAMQKLDATHGTLLASVTELGGRQNTLSLLTDSNSEVSLVNQKLKGELSQLDYAGASIDLANYQMSLQATQKTYLKINDLSLFNLL
jgi:flagellar hook-associated protein 3 FlgL